MTQCILLHLSPLQWNACSKDHKWPSFAKFKRHYSVLIFLDFSSFSDPTLQPEIFFLDSPVLLLWTLFSASLPRSFLSTQPLNVMLPGSVCSRLPLSPRKLMHCQAPYPFFPITTKSTHLALASLLSYRPIYSSTSWILTSGDLTALSSEPSVSFRVPYLNRQNVRWWLHHHRLANERHRRRARLLLLVTPQVQRSSFP